jgi:hypothetical protein
MESDVNNFLINWNLIITYIYSFFKFILKNFIITVILWNAESTNWIRLQLIVIMKLCT